MEKILIIDDEPFICENVERILHEDGYAVITATTGNEALMRVAEEEIDLVLLDLNLGPENGLDILQSLKENDPDILVIVITGFGSVETAVDSLKMGAYHYMKKPFKADALRVIVKLALQTQNLKREVKNLRRGDLELFAKVPMIGASKSLNKIVQAMTEVARHPSSTVLITGESGTGKELVARGIHHLSPRKEAPFISINCASMPVNLLESELFGHEKGAFTDAGSRRTGLFEEANMGTIFLDEIGEMDPAVQSKLLRVLEERQIRRVGGTRNIDIDVRVIAATNRNLFAAMKSGIFREDLFYRLNVFPLHIAPLRERQEDIPLLAMFYLEKYNKNFSRNYQSIDPEAIKALIRHPWPGNIRELKNVIERICIMHDEPVLLPEFLPHEMLSDTYFLEETLPGFDLKLGAKGLDEMLADIEKALVRQALDKSAGNVQMAARILKIPRGTLRYKMEKFGFGKVPVVDNQL